ncbi:hypothetical protein BJ170DRAFT_281748 [Xylariales sp. AK1849]|nr:hypothetical protein BJ170DRAFT_281748 [Xylariales sp. AK1849]
MLRRSHKKSRRGAKCEECRRRHIRCDQARPTCVNCAQAERICSYPSAQSPRSQSESAATQPKSDESPSATGTSGPLASSSTQDSPVYELKENSSERADQQVDSLINLTHLELFAHFGEIVGPLFAGKDPAFGQEYLRVYHKAAFSGDYLMHEVLAFSAKHLSFLKPQPQSQFYLEQATLLQTQALGLFNVSTQKGSNPEQHIAMFLFSSLLGTHLLSDTVARRDLHLEAYLSLFANYLNIHGGVRPIFQEYGSALINSEMRHFLKWGVNLASSQGVGAECLAAKQMISEASDLSTADVEACRRAIELLQCVIDAYKTEPDFPGPCPWVTVWPMSCSSDFTRLLIGKRPEALVVFAYYGAMLYQYFQDLWIVGDSGKHIVRMIRTFLGPAWFPCLQWPMEVVDSPSP